MKFPNKYDEYQYLSWYEAKFKKDKGLRQKLEQFRTELKETAFSDLEFISNIVQSVTAIASMNSESNMASVNSTINKLWRRNKEGDEVELSNIQYYIKDLVRTEIITDKKQETEFKERIKSISFEPIMTNKILNRSYFMIPLLKINSHLMGMVNSSLIMIGLGREIMKRP